MRFGAACSEAKGKKYWIIKIARSVGLFQLALFSSQATHYEEFLATANNLLSKKLTKGCCFLLIDI